jgi:hypothetical protein
MADSKPIRKSKPLESEYCVILDPIEYDPDAVRDGKQCIIWNYSNERNTDSIMREGLMPRAWPYVHFHTPRTDSFKLSECPPVEKGMVGIYILASYKKTWAMNSECKPEDLSKNPHTLAIAEDKGMKPLEKHHELCGRIEEVRRSNPGMCVMVRKDGNNMRVVSWDHCSETKKYTTTSFRCHSETHFEGVIPPSYFLYCMSRDKDGKPTMHINNMHTK